MSIKNIQRILTSLTVAAALVSSVNASVIAYWSLDGDSNADVGAWTSTENGTVTFATDAPSVLSNTKSASFTTSNSIDTTFDAVTAGVGGNPTISVAFWYKTGPSSLGAFNGLFNIGTVNGKRVEISAGSTSTDPLGAYYGNGNVAGATGTAVQDSEWHHVAWTYAAGHDTAKLYLDGADVSDSIANGANELDLDGVASFNGEQGRTFLMADVAIWNEELSASTVAGLADGSINVIPEPSTLGLLGFAGMSLLLMRRRR